MAALLKKLIKTLIKKRLKLINEFRRQVSKQVNTQSKTLWSRVVTASKVLLSISLVLTFLSGKAYASDDEFVPAYQNIDSYEVESADKYFVRHQGRNYYTSGKKNGFRVQENNEESTDETIGIMTFLIAPATIVYMNLEGWWD